MEQERWSLRHNWLLASQRVRDWGEDAWQWLQGAWQWVLALEAAEWSAIASWATVAVAVVAASVAYRQVREARRLREEQAQPYVVVYLEEGELRRNIDLVIKNLGATAATDISVRLEPTPERAVDPAGDWSPLLPDSLPVLVPGQEWRTLFDRTDERGPRKDLPDRYEAHASYKDARRKESFGFDYVLDWRLMYDRASVVTYGLHDLANAAREIDKRFAAWGRRGSAQRLGVYVREDPVASQSALRRRVASAIGRARDALGVSNVSPDGFVTDTWWGPEGRRRRERQQRVASRRVGRLLQRLFR
jgi:hypothetical protein